MTSQGLQAGLLAPSNSTPYLHHHPVQPRLKTFLCHPLVCSCYGQYSCHTFRELFKTLIPIFSKSKELEKQAIAACDSGRLSEAVRILDAAVSVAPDRPAPYNNRAQVQRLIGNVTAALEDLNKAIEVSGGQGRSACQAYCQRGEQKQTVL